MTEHEGAKRDDNVLAQYATSLTAIRWARTIARTFHAHLHGAEHLPRTGGALVVGNHTLLGLDTLPFTALIVLHAGRAPRFLAERNLWRVPIVRTMLDAVGAIPGAPDDAVHLLREGHLVLVYPGGVDDSFKLSSDAYRLQWGTRAGFARVAVRAGVPIVPMAATGIDELFHVRRKERWIGRRWLGSPRYDFPLPSNLLPHRVPLDYHVLAPIDTHGDADDAQWIEHLRAQTFEAIESVLATYRARAS